LLAPISREAPWRTPTNFNDEAATISVKLKGE